MEAAQSCQEGRLEEDKKSLSDCDKPLREGEREGGRVESLVFHSEREE